MPTTHGATRRGSPDQPPPRQSDIVIIDGQDFARVQLTRGRWALIDITDIPLVAGKEWKWAIGHGNGQAYRTEKSRVVLMHREILGLRRGDGWETDHANHDTLDNRRTNIRLATRSQNATNIVHRPGGSSVYRGVSWDPPKRRWLAQIGVERQRIILGWFIFERSAARAYNQAARKYHGEFAVLNDLSS